MGQKNYSLGDPIDDHDRDHVWIEQKDRHDPIVRKARFPHELEIALNNDLGLQSKIADDLCDRFGRSFKNRDF